MGVHDERGNASGDRGLLENFKHGANQILGQLQWVLATSSERDLLRDLRQLNGSLYLEWDRLHYLPGRDDQVRRLDDLLEGLRAWDRWSEDVEAATRQPGQQTLLEGNASALSQAAEMHREAWGLVQDLALVNKEHCRQELESAKSALADELHEFQMHRGALESYFTAAQRMEDVNDYFSGLLLFNKVAGEISSLASFVLKPGVAAERLMELVTNKVIGKLHKASEDAQERGKQDLKHITEMMLENEITFNFARTGHVYRDADDLFAQSSASLRAVHERLEQIEGVVENHENSDRTYDEAMPGLFEVRLEAFSTATAEQDDAGSDAPDNAGISIPDSSGQESISNAASEAQDEQNHGIPVDWCPKVDTEDDGDAAGEENVSTAESSDQDDSPAHDVEEADHETAESVPEDTGVETDETVDTVDDAPAVVDPPSAPLGPDDVELEFDELNFDSPPDWDSPSAEAASEDWGDEPGYIPSDEALGFGVTFDEFAEELPVDEFLSDGIDAEPQLVDQAEPVEVEEAPIDSGAYGSDDGGGGEGGGE